MKNLEKFNVQELGTQEMKKIDGGWSWKGALTGACLGAMTGSPAGVIVGAIAGGVLEIA